MKQIKISLASFTLILALTGVVIANDNRDKRISTDTAYNLTSSASWCEVILGGPYFYTDNITTQAAIRDNNNVWRLIYGSQSTSTPLKFVCP